MIEKVEGINIPYYLRQYIGGFNGFIDIIENLGYIARLVTNTVVKGRVSVFGITIALVMY